MNHRKSLTFLLCVIPLAAVAAGLLRSSQGQGVQVVPFKASGIYDLGEKAGWTVTAGGANGGKYKFSVKTNNHTEVQSGELDLSSGAARIEITRSEPAMLYMELTAPEGKPVAYGAAIAPTLLKPVTERPKDFDAFWDTKIAQLKKIPENPELTLGDSGKAGIEYATIKMDHVNGTHVYGQLAKPAKPGRYPALVVLQWASPPYPLQKPWAVDPASAGWIVLNIEPHDVLPTEPADYYQKLPQEIKNYTSIGQTDREKNYFVEMYLRGYRAVDYLSKRPDWDGKTIAVTGGSMGGQQALAVAGLHPKVTHVMANEPAGCDLHSFLHGRQAGYPSYPTDNPKILETMRYIDCVNFAPRIKATCLISMGFIDTVTPPAGIWTAFNLIKSPKIAAPMVDAPHNNLATWEQQQPFYKRYSDWLNTLARGEAVSLK